jgi:hypothetical protein
LARRRDRYDDLGRLSGEGGPGPVGLRVEVDGRLWGFGRAGHVDAGTVVLSTPASGAAAAALAALEPG